MAAVEDPLGGGQVAQTLARWAVGDLAAGLVELWSALGVEDQTWLDALVPEHIAAEEAVFSRRRNGGAVAVVEGRGSIAIEDLEAASYSAVDQAGGCISVAQAYKQHQDAMDGDQKEVPWCEADVGYRCENLGAAPSGVAVYVLLGVDEQGGRGTERH